MSAGPKARTRGRPRSEPARQAILTAAAELLLSQGVTAVSMDAVAELAGVSKATIYRWWPSKETLALDVLYEEWASPDREPPDTGTLRGDLLALLLPWIERAGDRPYGSIVGALITEARTDPRFGAVYRERFVEPRRAQARTIFQRAMARDEIPLGTDVEAAIDVLYGALYHRLLHGHAPLTQEFAETVVGIVVAGLGGIQEHLSRTNPADS
jgi:AcrR family transcriptional regulator